MPPRARAAARPAARDVVATVTARNSTILTVPVLGRVTLPPPERLAFLAGLGLLAGVGLMEWPVAVVVAVGHALSDNRRSRILRDFGEALEEA